MSTDNSSEPSGLTSFFRSPSTASARPPFPVHTLPDVVRRLAEEGAASLRAPADLIATPFLAFAGAVIGNSQRLKLKEGWEERPILYTAVIGRPGSAKSPAQKIAKEALDRLQRAEHRKYLEAKADYDELREEGAPPTYSHIYTTDATMEALAPMAASSPGIVAVYDELMGWLNAFNAYRSGKGSDRQKWLEGWAGADIKIDRKSADPIFVENPVICVTGGIQPDVLPQLSSNGREGGTDGFLERVLFSWPEEVWPRWTRDSVAASTQDAVAKLFEQLRGQRSGGPVMLSADAEDIFVSWYDEHMERMESSRGLYQTMQAKMPVHLARLALVLHCLTHPVKPEAMPLSSETMTNAIELTSYFRSHALAVLDVISTQGTQEKPKSFTLQLLGILRDLGCEGVSRSDLSKSLGHNRTAAEIDAALDELAALGLAEMTRVTTRGRPAEHWRCVVAGERKNEESAA